MTLTKKQRAWIARTSKILDDLETWDPDDPRLAPFKTENWRRKGFPLGAAMGPLFKPVVGDRIRKKGDK